LSEKFLIQRRTERDVIINVRRSSCKVPVVLVVFWWNEFSRQIFEKYSSIKFQENSSSGNWVFRTDGRTDRQTDMTELIAAYRKFPNAPKNWLFVYFCVCTSLPHLILRIDMYKTLRHWRPLQTRNLQFCTVRS